MDDVAFLNRMHAVSIRALKAQTALSRRQQRHVIVVAPLFRAWKHGAHGRILKTGDARQLVGQNVLFEQKLGGVVDVLPLATATAPRPKMRAARVTAVGRGVQQRQPFGEGEAPLIVHDPGTNALARNGVRHKNGPALMPAHRAASVRHRDKFKLKRRVIGGRARTGLFFHRLAAQSLSTTSNVASGVTSLGWSMVCASESSSVATSGE